MAVSIMRIGQAGFIVRADCGSISIDPFCGEAQGNCERLYPNWVPKNGFNVDIVCSTHPHWDHFDPITYTDYIIPKLFIGPTSCVEGLKSAGIYDRFESLVLDRGMSCDKYGFKITAVYAEHSPDSVGYIVEVEGKRIYFSGDSLYTPALKEKNGGMAPDLTCICINGKLGNMNYFEAARYCKDLCTKAAVPTHYDTILHNTENPKEFTDVMERLYPECKRFVCERAVWYDLEEVIG